MANLRSTWATLWASDSSRCWSYDTWSPDCPAARPFGVRLGTLAKLACLWWIWRLKRLRACPRSLSRPLSIHWRRIVGSIPHTHRELLPDSHSLASWCTRYAFSLAMVGNNFIVSVERYIKGTEIQLKELQPFGQWYLHAWVVWMGWSLLQSAARSLFQQARHTVTKEGSVSIKS